MITQVPPALASKEIVFHKTVGSPQENFTLNLQLRALKDLIMILTILELGSKSHAVEFSSGQKVGSAQSPNHILQHFLLRGALQLY